MLAFILNSIKDYFKENAKGKAGNGNTANDTQSNIAVNFRNKICFILKDDIATTSIKNKHKEEMKNTQEGTSKSTAVDVVHQWGQVSKIMLPIRDLVLDSIGRKPEQTGDGYSVIFRKFRN